jgi:hypothetical protein
MLEMILAEYAKQLFESSRMALDQLNTQLRWAYFDDSSRLVVRASYLDDGYVRARVDTATALDVNLLEILRELSWPFYNIAQIAVRADSLQNLDIALSALRDLFRPIIKGSIFNQSVTANTNIFSTSLTPSLATTTNPSYFRIFACFNANGVLSVVKTVGTTTVTMQLNSGNALNANCLYAFDIAVEPRESVNLQYSVDATALELKVEEVASTVV